MPLKICRLLLWFALSSSLVTSSLHAQARGDSGVGKKLYLGYCASCHGQDLSGGLGGSLINDQWRQESALPYLHQVIREGFPDIGMPAFGDTLKDRDIRAIIAYIAEMQSTSLSPTPSTEQPRPATPPAAHSFVLETAVDGLKTPWSMDFFPDGRILISERPGSLRIFENGRLSDPISNTPKVWEHGQGGLLDVALHPDYKNNGWIYLSFSESNNPNTGGMTAIVRGRIRDHQWVDEERIFQAPEKYHSRAGSHFGTRLVFQSGYLFFSIGDRGSMHQAQDLTRPNGKIHRIHDDGRIPQDNPFIDTPDAFPSIWSYGNRNPQGLALHPVYGNLWESEHGPKGGDEINLIEKGKNYGWPKVTHGINYNGQPITHLTEAEGMESPKLHWTPSIAVCGISFYTGDQFPAWKHHLFAGGLASTELHRLRINAEGDVVERELILKGKGRIRDVIDGPDGYLYLILNSPDRIVRMKPAP